jgi:calcineurin-like phosphoesterase family protein
MKKIESLSENIFFTSDLHFGHDGIIQFARRPFSNSIEMDECLIRNWNDTVSENGLVFVLGDIGFAPVQRIREIFEQLNGKKILIRGNHDCNYTDKLLKTLFDEIHDLLYIRIRDELTSRYTYIVMSHYPMLDWQSSFRGSWQLFGHLHTRNIPEFGTFKTHLFDKQYDVGVDNNLFRPVSFHELKQIIARQGKDTDFKQTNYY